jgi:hypothetical protein
MYDSAKNRNAAPAYSQMLSYNCWGHGGDSAPESPFDGTVISY